MLLDTSMGQGENPNSFNETDVVGNLRNTSIPTIQVAEQEHTVIITYIAADTSLVEFNGEIIRTHLTRSYQYRPITQNLFYWTYFHHNNLTLPPGIIGLEMELSIFQQQLFMVRVSLLLAGTS